MFHHFFLSLESLESLDMFGIIVTSVRIISVIRPEILELCPCLVLVYDLHCWESMNYIPKKMKKSNMYSDTNNNYQSISIQINPYQSVSIHINAQKSICLNYFYPYQFKSNIFQSIQKSMQNPSCPTSRWPPALRRTSRWPTRCPPRCGRDPRAPQHQWRPCARGTLSYVNSKSYVYV